MSDLISAGNELRPLDRYHAPHTRALSTAPTTEERGPDWRRMANALIRRKWIVAAVTVFAGAGGYAASRYVTPTYEARATIWIDESNQRTDRSPLAPSELFDAEGWVNLMRSDAVLDSVVAQQHLYLGQPKGADPAPFANVSAASNLQPGHYQLHVDPAGHRYTIADADGAVLDHAAPGDSLGHAIGLAWLAPADSTIRAGTYPFTLTAPRAVAERLAAALDVTINQQASYLTVTLAGDDPHRTTTTLNAITQRYVALATGLQRERLSELSRVLSQQAAAAKSSLATAERQLEQFRVATITLPHDRPPISAPGVGPAASDMTPSDPVLARFSTIEDRLAATRADRNALQRLITASEDTSTSLAEFEDMPVVHSSSSLSSEFATLDQKRATMAKLLERYTDAYPPVVQLKAQIVALRRLTIPATARALAANLTRTSGSLTDEVAQTADSLRAIPPRATQEARLLRDVAMATSLYNTLQQRYDETQIATATDVADVRILDPAAVPPWPAKNTASRLFLIALLGGFGVAMLGTILVDRWDPRFRYPEEVSRDMGMTILGTIPHVQLHHEQAADDPAFREGVRTIRMNLAYAYGAAGPVTLTVASPGSADGKSFVTLSLARAFAESGQRTVIIDGDVRRGALHRRCDLLRKPGLTDYLKGDVAIDRIVRPTGIAGVDLVTSGTRMEDAPELLGSPTMRRLMGELRSRFDVVLCDSPPLSAGIDPFVLGAVTANMLLVIRTGVSIRELTHAKLEVLDRMPIRLLGAVLNDVPDTAPFAYYSNYLPGYEAASEATGRSTNEALAAGVR